MGQSGMGGGEANNESSSFVHGFSSAEMTVWLAIMLGAQHNSDLPSSNLIK